MIVANPGIVAEEIGISDAGVASIRVPCRA